MSLMISPVSNVSFRAQEAAPQSIEDILSRPGAFAKPSVAEPTAKKNKHTFLKVLGGTLIAAGIVLYGLHYLPKKFPEIFKVTENIGSIEGFMAKTKAYITTAIKKGGEFVDTYADRAAEIAEDKWGKLCNLFKHKEAA